MPYLQDTSCRTALQARIRTLRGDSTPSWGRMSADQMLWHLNTGLKMALGKVPVPRSKGPPLPASVVKFMVLNLPWPKSAPTSPALIAREQYDFVTERDAALELIDELARRDLEGEGSDHPLFGRMTAKEVSRLQAKHIDHHLRQFGV